MAEHFRWHDADGAARDIPLHEGQSVAAALTEAGIRSFRATRRGGEGRGIHCGMGVCQDCLVELDGTPNSRACMAKARAGLVVRHQDFPGAARMPDRPVPMPDDAPLPAPDVLDLLIIGGGVGGLSAAIAARAVAASGAGMTGASAIHMNIFGPMPVVVFGTEAQKQRMLPPLIAGREKACFAVTEPNTGLDTTQLRSFAERRGDRYVVNGQKVWISTAQVADRMLLLARTTPRDQVTKKTEGLSTFIVDMRTVLGKGLTIRPIRTMMNHNSCEVFFDNMEVPAENLVGQEGRGFRYILDGMNAERLLIASESIGDAKWFTERSVAYSKDRVLFGKPIGANQGVQFPIAKAYAQMRAAEAIVKLGLQKFERGEPCGEEANMGKMLAADAAWAAAEACVQTHGGFGFAEEYDIERKFRETRLYQVAPISTNLILSYIGEHVLGMPRSY
ncbi:acyl-CoA dehydrogenase family protein [Leptolyngbya sp. 15MV]|nr:acyl-CoA dehydrogenase family protein [Leptolyngbya sp. 15MV]